MKVLVITDNLFLWKTFFEFISYCNQLEESDFLFACRADNFDLMRNENVTNIVPVDVKNEYPNIIESYDLVISMHCKQIFPRKMVENIRCVNIHPGLNPYNRGWYTQVFAILNKKPHGATIHEIDAELDHGPIIAQKEVPIYEWDTSKSVYDRVQFAEIDLIRENLVNILKNSYKKKAHLEEGNINYIKDFKELNKLDLDKKMTLGSAIDLLRALSHRPYKNAWFKNSKGEKIYVSIELVKEKR